MKLLSVSETVYLAKVRLMVCRRQQNQIGIREVTSVGLEIIISTDMYLGWYISVISALGRQRQEDHGKFEASPGYSISGKSRIHSKSLSFKIQRGAEKMAQSIECLLYRHGLES